MKRIKEKPKFIKLTPYNRYQAKEVYVNVDNIISFQKMVGGGTFVYTIKECEPLESGVTETPETIMAYINGLTDKDLLL